MANQSDASGRSLRTPRWRSWLLAPLVWAGVNLTFGLVSYFPLAMGVLSILHYFGPLGYYEADIPGLGLGVSAIWLLLLLPVFIWVNLALSRRLPLPRWLTWTGACILLIAPITSGFLFPRTANDLWY